MTKRTMITIIAALMAVTMTACGNVETNTEPRIQSSSETVDVTVEVDPTDESVIEGDSTVEETITEIDNTESFVDNNSSNTDSNSSVTKISSAVTTTKKDGTQTTKTSSAVNTTKATTKNNGTGNSTTKATTKNNGTGNVTTKATTKQTQSTQRQTQATQPQTQQQTQQQTQATQVQTQAPVTQAPTTTTTAAPTTTTRQTTTTTVATQAPAPHDWRDDLNDTERAYYNFAMDNFNDHDWQLIYDDLAKYTMDRFGNVPGGDIGFERDIAYWPGQYDYVYCKWGIQTQIFDELYIKRGNNNELVDWNAAFDEGWGLSNYNRYGNPLSSVADIHYLIDCVHSNVEITFHTRAELGYFNDRLPVRMLIDFDWYNDGDNTIVVLYSGEEVADE